MATSASRLLSLLSLLQLSREWTGAELARRLGVTDRTVRRDVDKLRDLGYPINASAGTAGGYRLGSGARLPPLLLEDDEALAVALGLAAMATSPVAGVGEASVLALTKLDQVLPSRLRARLTAMRGSVTRIGRPLTPVPPGHLTALAAAIAAQRQVSFDYERADGETSRRLAEPYRLVDSGQRWYLVAWDAGRQGWRTFRVDRIRTEPAERARYRPRDLPDADIAAYVHRAISVAPYAYDATVRLHAGAEELSPQVPPALGVLTPEGSRACLLRTGWDDADGLLEWLFRLDCDFEILGPPQFIDRARQVLRRLAAGLGMERLGT